MILAHSSMSSEVSHWLHSAIIKTFLSAGCDKQALAFSTSVQLSTLTTEDVELRLAVLLANG